jgi:hypothetical protein
MTEMRIKHNVYWELTGPDGQVKDAGIVHNMVLTNGFQIICDRLAGLGGQAQLRCIAIGDSNVAAAVGQTDLQGAELAFQISTNTRPFDNVARMYTLYGPGVGTGTIRETVIADTVAALGLRKCAGRTVLPDIVKGALDSLTIIWEFIFAEV